jgi:nucleotide-binding universal stress UspA family protein
VQTLLGMNTIMVGVDFSPESEIAIAHALELSRRMGTTLTLALATFIPDGPEGLSPSMYATYTRYSEILKERLGEERGQLAALRARYTGRGVELSQVLLDGRPEDRLPEASKQLGAVLTVVGTHGRTGFRRLSLGSVAERVVRTEERPVLVARGDAPAGGYRHIVVGLDFSPASRKAVQAALSYLAPGGTLDLVHCWQLPAWSFASGAPNVADNFGQLQADLVEDLAETGKKWLAEVGKIDGEVRFHSFERSPAAGLDHWARERGADLIVVGSHGHRGLRRWLIGSVAEATVRHAPCSVVVVH